MKEKHVHGIMNKYIGMRDIALGDLSIYLENPVGVGEHSDIGAEIEQKIADISKYDGIIDSMTKYFGKESPVEEPEATE